jgi:hypothetical protein
MKKSSKTSLLLVCTATMATLAGGSASAEMRTISATDQFTWISAGQTSTTNGAPLVVKVKKGDVVTIQVSKDSGGHGWVTLKGPGNQNPDEDRSRVVACGEKPKAPTANDQTKPAVLREIGCTDKPSNFGQEFIGSFQLEVLDNFQEDVNFWCVVHLSGMWGRLTLEP